MKFSAVLFLVLVSCTSVCSLSVHGEKLPPGRVILTSETPERFMSGGDTVFRPAEKSGYEKTKDYERSVVAVTNMPFTKAFRVKTQDYRGEVYAVEVMSWPTERIEAGDVLHLTFYLRALKSGHESGGARATVRFQRWGSPWTGWLHADNLTATVGQGWKKFQYPFVCPGSQGVKSCMLTFQLGYANQEIEVGGVELINYGKKVKPENLPVTSVSYPGRESNAPWRKAAAERIEKIRKGDLTVVVEDAKGRPVENAKVNVAMQRHAFLFGSEVNPATMWEMTTEGRTWTPQEAAKYKAMIKKYFNAVIVAHYIAWRQWERPSVRHERDAGVKAIDWANENGLKVVGQALIYPKRHSMPDDLKWLEISGEALHKRVMDHIKDEATALRGKMYAWQVVNEALCSYAFQVFDTLGGKRMAPIDPEPDWHDDHVNTVGGFDKMAEWFKAARRIDPGAKLVMNDAGFLTVGGKDPSRIKLSLDMYHRLAKYDTPIDVITEEGHFLSDLTDPARVVEILDQVYADQKREFWITEFDVNTPDLNLQGDYFRDFLTATFSHPSVGAFLLWGFWEPNHWQPQAAMVRADGSLRPAGKAWEDLVLKKWWTNASGKSDADGKFAVRGFLGDYVITVTVNGKTVEAKTFLPKNGNTVRIVVK